MEIGVIGLEIYHIKGERTGFFNEVIKIVEDFLEDLKK